MSTRTIDYGNLSGQLREFVDQSRRGEPTVITKDGAPVARIAPAESAAPEHRAHEPRRGITLAPAHEATDVHVERLQAEGDVPRRMRPLPSR